MAKRHELSTLKTTAREDKPIDAPIYAKLKALRKQGIDDPDVELFIAVFENNLDLLKAAWAAEQIPT